jgi:hypothetical protein
MGIPSSGACFNNSKWHIVLRGLLRNIVAATTTFRIDDVEPMSGSSIREFQSSAEEAKSRSQVLKTTMGVVIVLDECSFLWVAESNPEKSLAWNGNGLPQISSWVHDHGVEATVCGLYPTNLWFTGVYLRYRCECFMVSQFINQGLARSCIRRLYPGNASSRKITDWP